MLCGGSLRKMDIRIINSEDEIINVTNLSIKVIKDSLVGINERQEVIPIEKFGTEKEAKERLETMGEIITTATKQQQKAIVIKS